MYKSKYSSQRRTAAKRGIAWQFTYETWLEWWGDDIVNRGRRTGQLVMARFNDTGPYHPDNVKKVTCNENCREGNEGIPAPQKASPGPRNGMYGRPSAMRGRKQSDYAVQLITERAQSDQNQLVRLQVTCPHCGFTTNQGNANRWHLDKCKHKTKQQEPL